MIDPAPRVEAAVASAAKPRAAPEVEAAISSSKINTDRAPKVEPAYADPVEIENTTNAKEYTTTKNNVAEQSQPVDAETLRAGGRVAFEAPAAVIVGSVDRNICEKILPCFAERSFISFGEVRRYILVLDDGNNKIAKSTYGNTTSVNIFVYTDIHDPSPLYIIPMSDLSPCKEDRRHPSFYSHTISPEANTGLPFENQSKESLETVLLKDRDGSIAFQLAFDKNEVGDDAVEKFVAAIKGTNNGDKA